MGKGKFFRKLYEFLAKDGAPKLGAAAKRMGLSSKSSVEDVMRYVRTNPMASAFVLYEVYDIGSWIWDEFVEEFPEQAEQVRVLGFKQDRVEDKKSVNDILDFEDEFEMIKKGAAVVGSFERLLVLRAALNIDPGTYQLFIRLREMNNRL